MPVAICVRWPSETTLSNGLGRDSSSVVASWPARGGDSANYSVCVCVCVCVCAYVCVHNVLNSPNEDTFARSSLVCSELGTQTAFSNGFERRLERGPSKGKS